MLGALRAPSVWRASLVFGGPHEAPRSAKRSRKTVCRTTFVDPFRMPQRGMKLLRRTIWEIRIMLLLLLQMKPNNASQASCRNIRTPVNLGAFLLKFASADDHFSYRAVRFVSRLK